MRIVLDYRPALRERTGVGQYVHELASAVQGRLTAPDSLVLFSCSWKDRLDPSAVLGAERVDARIPVRLLNLLWHRAGWPPVELLTGRADIAHSAHPLLMPAARAAQVVTVHDLDFLDHPERTRAEIRRDYPALAARHARQAALVVTNSEYTAGMVRARLGIADDRILVCRPGAPEWMAGEPPAKPASILFVGTVEPRKNLPLLFRAYDRLTAIRPHAPPLVLAGKHVEHSAAILATLEALPATAARTRQLGYVSDDERQKLYREAAMVVIPSFDEGFGMTAVEAMQLGVPVIASRRGALPEVLGEAGILIDPADEEGLAAAMHRLLADPSEARAYGEAGRRRAATFSWTASAERLVAAYRELLARRGHAS